MRFFVCWPRTDGSMKLTVQISDCCSPSALMKWVCFAHNKYCMDQNEKLLPIFKNINAWESTQATTSRKANAREGVKSPYYPSLLKELRDRTCPINVKESRCFPILLSFSSPFHPIVRLFAIVRHLLHFVL